MKADRTGHNERVCCAIREDEEKAPAPDASFVSLLIRLISSRSKLFFFSTSFKLLFF